MSVFGAAMIVALERKIAQLEADLAKAREAERQLIADVVANGGVVPNNHWVARHRLEAKLSSAKFFLEAFR